MDGQSVTSIILQALYIIYDREGAIYNGIAIINGERRANVC